MKEYCDLFEKNVRKSSWIRRHKKSNDTATTIGSHDNRTNQSSIPIYHCPYENQISIIQLSTYQAKGPTYARALAQRKLLSNEQFCLSIESHSSMIESWDEVAKKEWLMINNEFAVLSNQPAGHKHINLPPRDMKRMEWALKKSGSFNDPNGYNYEDWKNKVYMNCIILFNDYGIPVSLKSLIVKCIITCLLFTTF